MKTIASLSLLALAHTVVAHGSHGKQEGETIQQYAQRHMSSEHHIDTFDVPSFFQLHDLNRDGVWDKDEIEAVYGVHHIYSQKKSKDDIEHQKKADHIVSAVLQRFDLNGDGWVKAEELEAVGLDQLPNFEGLGAEGHHYDIESEFFLHHEEEFHNTPETQTDESYNHPEDIEHFAHHEEIERKEAEKEAKFQGISVEEALKAHEHVEHPEPPTYPSENSEGGAQVPIADHPHAEQVQADTPLQEPPTIGKPKAGRVTPPEKQEPQVKFKGASSEGRRKAEWGTGEEGYKPPVTPSEKMRKNLPYKYKFKRNWGDF